MFASFRSWVCLAVLACGLAESSAEARDRRALESQTTNARVEPKLGRGQHGGDLRLLQSFYQAPRTNGESNHLFDLWESGGLSGFAKFHGLTNNRALIIDSHGTDFFTWGGPHYVFRPNTRVLPSGAELPSYSVRDFAQVMGPGAAASIHNVVIAGCNQRGALKTSEFRRYFVNATNITYMAAGNLSYKPCFFQALNRHSLNIEPLYGRPSLTTNGATRMEISRVASPGAVLLGNYVAELFEPGARRPYRIQRAGRELLEPGIQPSTSATSLLPPFDSAFPTSAFVEPANGNRGDWR